MANSGFIIHPFVSQVFTSGPSSGSEVSSSFNTTFSGSYSSSLLCDNTFVYREEDFENCPVVGECPIPIYTAITKTICSPSSNLTYGGSVPASVEATTLFVEYSTSATFASNIYTFSRSAASSGAFAVDLAIGLPSPPVSNTTTIYSRAYYDCGGGNSGSYTATVSAVCPTLTRPATLSINETRTVEITKTGTGGYAPGFCPGVNQVGGNINETISVSKTYTLGIDAFNGSNNTELTRIIVTVRKSGTLEASYILNRSHSTARC